MEAASGAAAGVEESSAAVNRWAVSTNWTVAGGSPHDAVSFETSEEDAPTAPTISTPLILLRPPAEAAAEEEDRGFLPCEVTVCLNGKYEIHRIYARSTARVYEVYFATDKQNKCKEYLCTVRCGVASEEVTPLSSDVASLECENGSYATSDKQDKMSLADSNSSNEDGWVEVKIPDTPSHDHKINVLSTKIDGNSNTDCQIYYEATADIVDASPCMSVTLRFLSLKTKTCVHVSEIYIYADPVESDTPCAPVSMGENFGGNSLLAMFMPSLLQLSKSGSSTQDNFFGASALHKYQYGVQKKAELVSSDMAVVMPQEAISDKVDCTLGLDHKQYQLKPENTFSTSDQRIADQKVLSCSVDQKLDQVHDHSEIKPENMQLGSNQKITEREPSSSTSIQETENVQSTYSEKQIGLVHMSESSAQEEYKSGDRIEKVLDELVLRVTRIEAFCSRFEESLLKPLSCIETRLQNLERLFHTAGGQFPREGACTRISAPEFSSDLENDSLNPSPALGDNDKDDTVLHDPPLPVDAMLHPSLPASGVTGSVPDSRIYPGLVRKAPEFSNEDYECLKYDAGLASDASCSRDKKLCSTGNKDTEGIKDDVSLASDLNCSEDKKLSSFDHALASALQAFLSSKPNATVMEPYEPCAGDESVLNPSLIKVLSNGADTSVSTLNEVKDTMVSDSKFPVSGASEKSVRIPECDSGCSIRGICEVSAALDGSSTSTNALASFLPGPVMDSGLIFKAPEFSSDEDEFDHYDDTTETYSRNFHEDEAYMHMDGEAVSDLVAFLSLEKLNTSNCTSNLVAISSDPYDLDKSETSSFVVGVPCEGADGPDTQNHGISTKYTDLSILTARTGLDCKFDENRHWLERLSTSPLGCSLERRGDKVKLHGYHSTSATASEERLLMEDLSQNVSFISDCCASKNWQGGVLNDSNDDQVDPGGASPIKLGKGWTGSSSTFSSLVTNSIKNKDQVGFMDSSASTADHYYDGQAANENGSIHENMMSTTGQNNVASSANDSTSPNDNYAGCRHEQTPTSASSCDVPIWDVKFVPEIDWSSRVPLQVLLGESCEDDEVQDPAAIDVTECCIATDQLLDGMENLSLRGDNSSDLCNDSACIKQQDFPSLI
ncbi:hypothetical protein OPV22_004054 [Ensete ventricosum]|uniref:Uncharacterized protein n=1 Tax=Ensete ventricosum TaxID=4639 RepID=A0AAV8S2N5_ENSVE|nr:hypothetical protein OPV22_004054 [Ensete ventricosum]